MTDAKMWRQIAAGKKWEDCGLCWGPRVVLGWNQAEEQVRRMRSAVDCFRPAMMQCNGVHYWPVNCPEGDEQRTWAALFLAAMADADGGNHKETDE